MERLARYASAEGIDYVLLSDVDLAVITSWGLVNPSNPKLPHPTAVIVDAEGVIQYVRQDVDYRRRPSSEELLTTLRRMLDLS